MNDVWRKMEITELPAGGLIPQEHLQTLKDYNETEIRLFSTVITPWYDRFKELGLHDPEEFKIKLMAFFEDTQWRSQLVRELREWIETSRIESPGAEPLYTTLEEIINSTYLGTPIESEEVDEFDLEHKFLLTSQPVEQSTDQQRTNHLLVLNKDKEDHPHEDH